MAACTYNQLIKYVHEFRWYETHRIHKLHIFRSCWKGVYLFSLYCGEGACYFLSDLFHLRKQLSRFNTVAGTRLIEPIKTHLGLPQKIQNRVLTNISRGNSVKPGYLFKSTQNFSFNSLALWHHHYVRCVCMCVCMNIKKTARRISWSRAIYLNSFGKSNLNKISNMSYVSYGFMQSVYWFIHSRTLAIYTITKRVNISG